jgi:predicted nuclease of restriction endonuclease-like RecB superfamily
LLPKALCLQSTHLEGERIVPSFMAPHDHGWLAALLAEHERFVGKRHSEWLERMRAPLGVRAPRAKVAVAAHWLALASRQTPKTVLPSREVRWHLFRAAAESDEVRESVLQRTAHQLHVTVHDLEAWLFADLSIESRVAPLPERLTVAELARQCNLALVSSLVRRARRLRIFVWDDALALIRQVHRAGLICLVEQTADGALALDVSGPFALFRHTAVYGRALAALIPRVFASERFELQADCVLHGASIGPRQGADWPTHTLVLRSGDPVATEVVRPETFRPSRLHARFVRDFQRMAPDWAIVHEPAPIAAEGMLLFPDFEIVCRAHPERRWWIQIAGFWTPDYVADEIRRYHAAGVTRIVVCVDRRRACAGTAELPSDASVVRFEARIDPADVLRAIAGS